MFDPLVFPCATGDANYIGGRVETIEGIRLIKQTVPRAKTVLGISNISFGLPACGARSGQLGVPLSLHQGGPRPGDCQRREAGAIRVRSTRAERQLAENLLFNTTGEDDRSDRRIGVSETPSRRLALNQHPHRGHRRALSRRDKATSLKDAGRRASVSTSGWPTTSSKARKDGLVAGPGAQARRRSRRRSTIINGPLMNGMDEVGRLFNNNELIVAEVLQSAEAMKAAVNHLRAIHGQGGDDLRAAA